MATRHFFRLLNLLLLIRIKSFREQFKTKLVENRKSLPSQLLLKVIFFNRKAPAKAGAISKYKTQAYLLKYIFLREYNS